MRVDGQMGDVMQGTEKLWSRGEREAQRQLQNNGATRSRGRNERKARPVARRTQAGSGCENMDQTVRWLGVCLLS
jgi:hypothetical protein